MKKVLFTGAYGFLGNNIIPILKENYEIDTLGLSSENKIKIDLSKEKPELIESYDIVLHAGSKVYMNDDIPKERQSFFDTNYLGTINLCKALEKHLPKSFIFTSSVAVYGEEEGENITEDYPRKGKTPYAKSKILAEDFLIEWCNKHNVVLTILRPALIVGHNAKGNLGSMLNLIRKGFYFNIGNKEVRKSVVMAEDIAILIPKVANKGGIYNVCDSHHPSFHELSACICKLLGKQKPKTIPYWLAKLIGKAGDIMGKKIPVNSHKINKMSTTLTFSNEKAKRELSWEPIDVLTHYKI